MANEAGHQDVAGNVSFPRTPWMTPIIERISETEPGDVQKTASSHIALLVDYYGTVLGQARQSFRWALIAAVVGLILLLAAVGFLLARLSVGVAVISAVAGTIVEIISGLNFFLYGQATKQLSRYHDSLDRNQRSLLAYSVCESLEGEERQKARSTLVATITGQ